MTRQAFALDRYIEEARIEELASEWRQRGYAVTTHQKVEDLDLDLLATRDDERIVFKVTTARGLTNARQTIKRLAAIVATWPRAQFHLVVANLPKSKSIEVDGISALLHRTMTEETHLALDLLSSHTRVEEVVDVEIDRIHVSATYIAVTGTATVEVQIHDRSAGDVERGDGVAYGDALPMTFDLTLNHDLTPRRVERIDVDTSSLDVPDRTSSR